MALLNQKLCYVMATLCDRLLYYYNIRPPGCVWFSIHIGCRGIMILHELSLHDSSTLLCVLFCVYIGYRGIMILQE